MSYQEGKRSSQWKNSSAFGVRIFPISKPFAPVSLMNSGIPSLRTAFLASIPLCFKGSCAHNSGRPNIKLVIIVTQFCYFVKVY